MTVIAETTQSWSAPVKKAAATFVFCASGSLLGAPLLGIDIWQGAALAGIGGLINYAYRASEAYLKSAE